MNSKYFIAFIPFVLFLTNCSDRGNDTVNRVNLPQDTNKVLKIIPANEMIFESGVYPMNKASVVTQWEQDRGAEVSVVTVFPSRESWKALQNTWFMDDERIPSDFKGTLSIGMPLWPEDGNLIDASSGKYDSQWQEFGKSVATKYPNAYIRIGLEMNINDMYYKATPATADQWKQAFIHAVTSLKKASSDFRIVFNPNEGVGQTGTKDATLFYPGDKYVDLIGIDAYDWWPGYTSEANISKHRDSDYGWNWWLDFAKKHHKKFCVPEWGIATANPHSGGDNPLYINFVYSWLSKNKDWIQYECYFDESDDYIRSDLFTGFNPKATKEYKEWMPLLKKK